MHFVTYEFGYLICFFGLTLRVCDVQNEREQTFTCLISIRQVTNNHLFLLYSLLLTIVLIRKKLIG